MILLAFSLLVYRLYGLQIKQHEYFVTRAEQNRIAIIPLPPSRGQIADRNGVVLAQNYTAYTLEINPHQVDYLNETIDELSKLVRINDQDRKRFQKALEENKSFEHIPIRFRLTDEEIARFSAHRYRFPGVDVYARFFRQYPFQETASHILGYIGKISEKEKQIIEEEGFEAQYRGTEHIGKTGIEKSYESVLHGITGIETVEVDAVGKIVRVLSQTPAIAGQNIRLTIDIHAQRKAEQIFTGRRGVLVAIEPKTGEVIALVSKPGFDPNLFVDGIDSTNWNVLNTSPDRPLLNRALSGRYPPGSTYKPFMALAALETGRRTPADRISDPGFFVYGGHRFRGAGSASHGIVDMHRSIVVSSDVYYYQLAVDMGVDAIHDYMKKWGFGELTGIDLPNEFRGILPSSEWKLARYKEKWIAGESVSIGIGQGYNSFTPIQLGQAIAGLANRGVVMRPRLVLSIQDPLSSEHKLTAPEISHKVHILPEHYEIIKSAMIGVNQQGTGASSFRLAPYLAAGKTGTSQVIGIKQNESYNAQRIHELHRDHAIYTVFAPANDPKIALFVLVENGGFGGRTAAPIARQFIDYYLLERLGAPLAGQTRLPKENTTILQRYKVRVSEQVDIISPLSETSLNQQLIPLDNQGNRYLPLQNAAVSVLPYRHSFKERK